MKKRAFLEKIEGKKIKFKNEKQKDTLFIILKKNTIKKREKNSTIETKYDKYSNEVSLFETVKKLNEEKVTKENNILLKREPTTSLLSGNIKYLDQINTSLIVEADVIKRTKKTIKKQRVDSMFLFNDVEDILYDRPIEKDTEKRKCEQAVSESQKWHSLIKTVAGRNITVLSEN